MLKLVTLACGLTLIAAAQAAPPAGAPADSTGQCKDGTYYSGATKKGACKGHKGVKEWWGGKTGSATKADSTKTESAKAESAKTESTKTVPAAAPATKAAAPASKPAPAQAAGGGPGQVWVNTESKVYHCSGDQWYGKTKEGQYMSESEATAKGFRASHGKACS
jgi:hypothetical protein